MIVHDVIQGSPEWYTVRRGVFSASLASKLLTPTGRLSTQYKGEIGRIIAERMGWQEPEPPVQTVWMSRGIDMEAEARTAFTLITGHAVQQVGFITDSSGLVGASPDGLTDLHEPCEFKCPKPSTHVRWLLDGSLPDDHKQQVHFQMVICGAERGWFMSYSPPCAPLLLPVQWDEYTSAMADAINTYINDLIAALKQLGVDS